MSVVVVGGNDRMATRYKDICAEYKCKAKVFTQMPAGFDDKIGSPDLVVMFTDTCSHKMAKSVKSRSERFSFPVVRIHNASVNALRSVLSQYAN